MDYQQGKTYELKVVRLERDSKGYEYFLVTDGKNEYRVYGVQLCQSKACPDTVTACVKSIDISGRIKFTQDLYSFINAHYEIDEVKSFRVSSIGYDSNGHQFYWIKDDLMRHKYYCNGDQKYQIGEDIQLKIIEFDTHGFIRFSEINETLRSSLCTRRVYVPSTAQPTDSQQGILDIGNESTNLELKTSIVFPPGSNGVPDVAKQCFIIIKTLASFMNADGGDLYIGVHDKTHAVTGIETDYPHLNDDLDGKIVPLSQDGFQLKIRNVLNARSQSVANELIDFEFSNNGVHDYCVIHVKPSNRPIWIDGNLLYQRIGNRIQMLRGDDINHFVMDRMVRPIIESQTQSAQSLDTETFAQLIRDVLNEQRPHVVAQTASNTANNPKEWYIWFNDGSLKRYTNTEYERIKDSLQDDHFRLPVCSSDKDIVVVLCYASGFINMITVKDLKESIPKRTKINKEGYNLSDNAWPIHIYLAHQSDMLAGFSKDAHGTEYVKIHHLTAYNPKSHPKNKGALFIPKTGIVTEYKLLPATEREHVKPLIMDSSKTSTDFGVPLSSVSCAEAVQFISSYQ